MSEKELIVSLHGLRGLAVLYVVASHIGNAGLMLFPFPHGAVGKVGVWIFFGLSAFLLTAKLREQLSEGSRVEAIGRYFVHRIFRIYPLFVFVLLLHLVVGDIDSKLFFRHLVLTEGWGELWAIPTEFQYYLIIPIVAALPVRAATWLLGLGAFAALAAGFRDPDWVFSNSISLLPKAIPFLLASLLALYRTAAIQRGGVVGVLGVLLLLVCTFFYRSMFTSSPSFIWMAPWLSLALGLAVVALIHSALQKSWLTKLLSGRPIVWIGKVSFSIYLLHMFVVRCALSLEISPYAAGWLVVLVTLAVSAISYQWIEAPGVRWGRVISERIVLGRGGRGSVR